MKRSRIDGNNNLAIAAKGINRLKESGRRFNEIPWNQDNSTTECDILIELTWAVFRKVSIHIIEHILMKLALDSHFLRINGILDIKLRTYKYCKYLANRFADTELEDYCSTKMGNTKQR